MRLSINMLRTVLLLISVLSSFVLIVIYYSNDIEGYTYPVLGAYSLLCLLFGLVSLCGGKQYRFLSFPVMLYLFAWIFHFGFFPCYYFEKESMIFSSGLRYFSRYDTCKAFGILLVLTFALNLGLVLGKKNKGKIANLPVEFTKEIGKIFRISFVILLVPYLFTVIMSLFSGGYLFLTQLNSFQTYINEIISAVAIFVFYEAVNQKNNKAIIAMYLIFAINIFTGRRNGSISLFVAFLLIQFLNKKTNIKFVVKYFTLGLLGIYLIHSIAKFRFDFSTLFPNIFSWENFTDYLLDNPVFTLIGEFGSTVGTLITSVMYIVPNQMLKGRTYVAAFFYFIPGFNRLFPDTWITFLRLFPSQSQHNWGGSFYGEAYANFGIWGAIPIFIFGVFGATLYQTERNCKNELFKCWIYVMYFVLIQCVRGYIKNVFFLGVWVFIIVQILSRKQFNKFSKSIIAE